jgi:CRISPR-associated protein Csx17
MAQGKTIRLPGCSPTPLAHYLKALGMLRVINEQLDGSVRGRWEREEFVLHSKASFEDLTGFFLYDYAPTPIIAPWNAGCGLWQSKKGAKYRKFDVTEDPIAPLYTTSSERFEGYARTLDATEEAIQDSGFKMPSSSKDRQTNAFSEQKARFISCCRALWPNDALKWLDAATVLLGERAEWPPLLGTGGLDGNLEFSINYAARLQDVIDPGEDRPTDMAQDWLRASLLDSNENALLSDAAIGQFYPAAVGGYNQTSGFKGNTVMNPWDFVLMLEGAVMFAASSVKRLEAAGPGVLAAPFCVRHVGVGHGSADPSEQEEARAETWFPLWERPASAAEIYALLAEGRAEVGGRPARDGLDFARAVAGLGVDRGICAFQRMGFQKRYGRTYLATPLNRVRTRRRPEADLLGEIDAWLDRFRGRARSDNAPNAVAAAARNLERHIFNLCLQGGSRRVTDVLVALGGCEQALARSLAWTRDKFLHPLTGLSDRWLHRAYDGTAEFRLAAVLASTCGRYGEDSSDWITLRPHLEPVRSTGPRRWEWTRGKGAEVVWHTGDPVRVMNEIMRRRILLCERGDADGWTDRSPMPARLSDVAAFLDGRVNGRRMFDLLWGMVAIDWQSAEDTVLPPPHTAEPQSMPTALYALMKPCFSSSFPPASSDKEVPVVGNIHRLAASGDGLRASRLAARRLLGSGYGPTVRQVALGGERVRRTAAGLLFPLWRRQAWRVALSVLEPESMATENADL